MRYLTSAFSLPIHVDEEVDRLASRAIESPHVLVQRRTFHRRGHVQERHQVFERVGRIRERIILGIRFEEEVERIDDRHVGRELDVDRQTIA